MNSSHWVTAVRSFLADRFCWWEVNFGALRFFEVKMTSSSQVAIFCGGILWYFEGFNHELRDLLLKFMTSGKESPP